MASRYTYQLLDVLGRVVDGKVRCRMTAVPTGG